MMPLAKALLLPQVLLLLGVEIGFAFKQTACFAPNALVAGAASRRVPLSSLAAVLAGRSCQPRRALALRGVRGAFHGVPKASESSLGRCQYVVGVGMCGAAGGMSGTDEGRGNKGVEEEGRTISSIQDEQDREDEPDYMDEIFDVIDGDEGSQDRRITCFVDQIVTVSGKEYRLGYPVDTPVVISLFDDDDDLVPANDSDLEVLMPLAKEALAVKNVELIDSPVVATVRGEIEQEEEVDEETAQNLPEDEEYVRVLTSFEHDDVEYHVVEPFDPVVLVFTEVATDKGVRPRRGVLVEKEMLHNLMPAFEKAIGARLQ